MSSLRSRFVIVVALTVAAGCAREARAPEPTSLPAESLPAERVESPMTVRWEQRALSPTSASVVALIERHTKVPLTLTVRVDVPTSAKVSAGRTSFSLAPNAEAQATSELLELSFERAPTEDLVLHVDGDGTGMGIHAAIPYRFGRPAPVPDQVLPAGEQLHKGKRNFGQAIPVGNAGQSY